MTSRPPEFNAPHDDPDYLAKLKANTEALGRHIAAYPRAVALACKQWVKEWREAQRKKRK